MPEGAGSGNEPEGPGGGPSPLAGVRVLDLTDGLGVRGATLLAALGADVVRPEPPGGDPLRTTPPARDEPGGPGPAAAAGLAHVAFNSGKHSVVIDRDTEEGRRALVDLIAASDITICSPGRSLTAQLGLDPEAFAAAHPDTALVLLDPFPAGSPHPPTAGEDLILSATGGFAWLCGDTDSGPEHPKGNLASTYAAIAAALAGLVGLTARRLHGRAGWYELTAQEAVAFSTAQTGDPNEYTWHDRVPGRFPADAPARLGLHQCADDRWVSFVMFGGRFDALIEWLQESEIDEGFRSPEWYDYTYFFENLPTVGAGVAELCRRSTAAEMVAEGQKRLLMVMPVAAVDELLADPQLVDRKMFEPVAGRPGLCLPRAPMVFSDCALPRPRRAPELGEHDPQVLERWGPRSPVAGPTPSIRSEPVGRPTGRPLEGLRVVDFSWMLAAPLATRFLADLGADVIRIESHLRRDLTREIGTQPPGWASLDTNAHQHIAGSNKRSVAVNLHHPEGVALARRLIETADVVLDNYRPGTMTKWGFGPEQLLAERPDLVVVTMPAVGSSGPHSRFGAIGNGVAAYGGVNMLTGPPDQPPRGVGPMIADFFSPLMTVQGTLAALHHRAVSGRGQHLDCSMLESTVWLLDTAFAEYQLLGTVPPRIGNRSRTMAPHGIFPCDGEDEWIAIAVRSDAEWRAFCRLAAIPVNQAVRFATRSARLEHVAEVEAIVTDATRRRSRWQLAERLGVAGVPAAPVESVLDHMTADPGMADRFARIEHPYGMTFLVQNQFIRPEGVTVPNRRAPMIGEHTDEVLLELGLAESEIAELFGAGVLR